MTKEVESKKHTFKNVFSGKKNVWNILIAILLVALFVFFGTSMVNQDADISRLQNQKAELSAKLDEQQQTNNELQAVLDSDDKDDYIEKKAREKGYVKSDEVVFYDISSGE
ncbi:MAG: septum formation initiator family protein [Eubacterium sp.]